MSLLSQLKSLRYLNARCRVNSTRVSLFRARGNIHHVAPLCRLREAASLSNIDLTSFRSLSSSANASNGHDQPEKPKKFKRNGQLSVRRKVSLLLNEERCPPGSFTPVMRRECRHIVKFLLSKDVVYAEEFNMCLALIKRMIKEDLVTGGVSNKTNWLYDRRLLHRLVRHWRDIAQKNEEHVIQPLDLAATLEQLSSQAPDFKIDIFTFSNILDVAIHQKSPEEAPLVAESLLKFMREKAGENNPELRPNEVIWNQVLDSWAMSKLPEAPDRMEALLGEMEAEGIELSGIAWSCLMKYWEQSERPERFERMEELLDLMKTCGVEPSFEIWTQLLNTHLKSGQRNAPRHGQAVIDRILNHGLRPITLMFNLVLHAWSRSNLPDTVENAEALFQRMKAAGVQPDSYTYGHLIHCYATQGEAYRAEALLDEMVSEKVVPNIVIYSQALEAWSRSDSPQAAEKAEELLERMKATEIKPDATFYSRLIYVHATHGNADRAEAILRTMMENYKAGNKRARPSLWACNDVLYAHCKSKDANALQRARKLLQAMTDGKFPGVKPDKTSYNRVIQACLYGGVASEVEQIVERVENLGMILNTETFNEILKVCIEQSDPAAAEKAEAILRHMIEISESSNPSAKPDIQSFNMVIEGWANSGHENSPERGLKVFAMTEEIQTDVLPDILTYSAVVRCLTRNASQELVAQADTILRRIPSSVSVAHAAEFFKLQSLVTQTWIRAECFSEAESLQLDMFDRHIHEAPRPNPKWYSQAIQAWIAANEVERAKTIYWKMRELESSQRFSCGQYVSVGKELLNAWKQSDLSDEQRLAVLLEGDDDSSYK